MGLQTVMAMKESMGQANLTCVEGCVEGSLFTQQSLTRIQVTLLCPFFLPLLDRVSVLW